MTPTPESVRLSPPETTRTRALIQSLVTLLLGGLLAATPSLVAAPASALAGMPRASATAMAPETFEKRVQRWVNAERRQHGLRGLRMNRCSDGTAERWSRHLVRRNLFEHQPMSRILDRCDAFYAGETLARGSMGPRRLVRMWLNSPPHRAILLSGEPRRIGIGATLDNQGRWVTTANFIRP